MTPEQRVELREIAGAATSGPWEDAVLGSEGYAVFAERAPGDKRLSRVRVARLGWEDWDTDRANAAHIAAFDPPTVLELLDALDEAEGALDCCREQRTDLRELVDVEREKNAALLADLKALAGELADDGDDYLEGASYNVEKLIAKHEGGSR
jgi:hypothetical protein